MSGEILRRHHEVWQKKPILRILYSQWYQELVPHLLPGRTLELGGGTGTLKQFLPDVICTDIVSVPWLDFVADAQHLPLGASSCANIVLFDVLHHIENIRLFFDEALRVLHLNGRIIIMDPYVSWASWPIYHFFHPEPVDLYQDPLQPITPRDDRRPFDANQAVATILFERSQHAFVAAYPQFQKVLHKRLAFFAYPLSGGFERHSLLPLTFVRPLLAVERMMGFLSRILAFRILVVLEKKA
jgi:SAM-dependent methyltransferase